MFLKKSTSATVAPANNCYIELTVISVLNYLHAKAIPLIGTHMDKYFVVDPSLSANDLRVLSLRRLYGALQLQRTLRGYLVRRRVFDSLPVGSASR